MRRNIGGSLLASSSPQILTPLEHALGALIVVEVPEDDTHALVLRQGGQERELARHPNGFSCRNLAERIVTVCVAKERNASWAMDQLDYILRCGGSGDRELTASLMQGATDA